MDFRFKIRYIPVTYTRIKDNWVLGEKTYKIADLEKYKESLSWMDFRKIAEEGLASSYSQFFQNSSDVEAVGRLNHDVETENKDISSMKDDSYATNH